ncbi:ABC transporter ATP-binding protein [Caldanaerobacter subterraneus KAk]|uniref:ABC transporter ATP-binding protein n=1 Tax=Caldanaerobacter subterraneus TaxID=911092 RepID=UPI0032C00427
MGEIILTVKDLKKYFDMGRKKLKAVDGVSFTLKKGESLGLVGESGSGKSTVARLILKLIPPTSGEVYLFGKPVFKMSKAEEKMMRRKVQIVFQNPYMSLFPHLTIGTNIGEPLRIHNIGGEKERRKRVMDLMELVGVPLEYFNSFPHELSGGQQQRVAIARALALEPSLLILDEPVSSLDVSIQVQILNLLKELQNKKQLSYIFIAHDLAVIEYISTTIAVMYLGKLVEYAPRELILDKPLHPYTQALLEAVPVIGHLKRVYLEGEIPSPIDPPSGCPFHPRCKYRKPVCKEKKPELKGLGENHFVACHLY